MHLLGLLPFSKGHMPGRGALDLEVHNRLFETLAILPCHLILHERFRSLTPHLVNQDRCRVLEILLQASFYERFFPFDLIEQLFELADKLRLWRSLPI